MMNKKERMINELQDIYEFMSDLADAVSSEAKSAGIESVPDSKKILGVDSSTTSKTLNQIPEYSEKKYYIEEKISELAEVLDKTYEDDKLHGLMVDILIGYSDTIDIMEIVDIIRSFSRKNTTAKKTPKNSIAYCNMIYHGAKCNNTGDEF